MPNMQADTEQRSGTKPAIQAFKGSWNLKQIQGWGGLENEAATAVRSNAVPGNKLLTNWHETGPLKSVSFAKSSVYWESICWLVLAPCSCLASPYIDVTLIWNVYPVLFLTYFSVVVDFVFIHTQLVQDISVQVCTMNLRPCGLTNASVITAGIAKPGERDNGKESAILNILFL